MNLPVETVCTPLADDHDRVSWTGSEGDDVWPVGQDRIFRAGLIVLPGHRFHIAEHQLPLFRRDPTILVEQAVVNVITEQQRWLTATHPQLLTPKYLIIGVKQNLAGRAPTPATTCRRPTGQVARTVAAFENLGKLRDDRPMADKGEGADK